MLWRKCFWGLYERLDVIGKLAKRGGDYLNYCVKPLVYHIKTMGPDKLLAMFSEDPTMIDWELFYEINEMLEELQLEEQRKDFVKKLMPYNKMQEKFELIFGLVAYTLIENEEALKYIRKIDYDNQLLKTDHELLSKLGLLELKLGNNNIALKYFRKSVKIQKKILGTGHQDIALSYINIGLVWYDKGKFNNAIEFFEKGLSIMHDSLGPHDLNLAKTFNNIGLAWDELGNFDKAIDFYKKSLEIYLKVLGPDHLYCALVTIT